jgi:hypothetical protein
MQFLLITSKALLMACQQIVNCLVKNILQLEEASLARGPSSGESIINILN